MFTGPGPLLINTGQVTCKVLHLALLITEQLEYSWYVEVHTSHLCPVCWITQKTGLWSGLRASIVCLPQIQAVGQWPHLCCHVNPYSLGYKTHRWWGRQCYRKGWEGQAWSRGDPLGHPLVTLALLYGWSTSKFLSNRVLHQEHP